MDNENYSFTDENTYDSGRDSSSNVMYGVDNTSRINNNFGKQLEESCTFNRTLQSTHDLRAGGEHRSGDLSCIKCSSSADALYHVDANEVAKLKDSTKKLLCLLEDIQAKTLCNNALNPVPSYHFTQLIQPFSTGTYKPDNTSVTNIIGAGALERLEIQTKDLEAIHVEQEEDDCSIFNRLTRKCNCLNHPQYNDFVIHFNENTKYFTSTIGEIIKNMRIIKKFLYMGGDYSKHSLMFLNEGMSDSTHSQRIDIAQGIAHSDVCNVFDDRSIVTMYISWPCKYEYFGDSTTQHLTANFLYKLSQLEEGRRYLNFTSKITNELKRVIRKKSNKLEFETVETLNSILNLLHPPLDHANATYYCKFKEEGFGFKTLTGLIQYRKYMTVDEVFTHLDLLQNMSNADSGKKELTLILPKMLPLFKEMLTEYDNSEMNIIITNILNNIISKNMIQDSSEPKTVVMADTSTEPIKMKNGTNQIPIRKNPKKLNRSKMGMGASNGKFKQRQSSKKKVSGDWNQSKPKVMSMNGSKKFGKDELRSTVIIVPVEEISYEY